MTSKTEKLVIVSAMVAPLLLFFTITVTSILWPGYNFVSEYVSILGSVGSPVRLFINLFGFALFGTIMMAFSFVLEKYLKSNRFSKTGTRLFLGSGALVFLMSIFPSDRGIAGYTFEGRLHTIMGSVCFIMLPLAIIWYGMAFEKDDYWGKFWVIVSYFLAGIGLALGLILAAQPYFFYNGFLERVGIGTSLLWIFLVALNLFFENIYNEWTS